MKQPKKYKANQQVLNDFTATLDAKPELTQAEIFQKFPEFNNDPGFLQVAMDYHATVKSGKYGDAEEINAKFPELDFGKKKGSTLPTGVAGPPEQEDGLAPNFDQSPQESTLKTEPKSKTDQLQDFLGNQISDWYSQKITESVQPKYDEYLKGAIASRVPKELQESKFEEVLAPHKAEFDKWNESRFDELQKGVTDKTDIAKLNEQYEKERDERWEKVQNNANRDFNKWYQTHLSNPEFDKQDQEEWDRQIAEFENSPEFVKEVEQKTQEADDTFNKFAQMSEQREQEADFQKNKETNPAYTLGKKMWSTMRYQLPADLIGASIATQQAPFDITKAIDKLLPENVSRFLTGGKGTRPSEDPQFGLRDKAQNEKIKTQLLQAYKLRSEGHEADKYLVDSLDKAQDSLDYLNWAFAALGQAAGQIPAAIVSRGATAYGQEIGTIYLDGVQKIADEKGLTPEQVIEQGLDDSLYPILFGMAAGRLESLGAKGVGDAVLGKKELIQSLRDRTLGFLGAVGKAGGTESLTEGAQTILEQLGVGKAADKSWEDTFKGIDGNDIKESMAQGAVGGSGLTGAGRSAKASYTEVKNIVKPKRTPVERPKTEIPKHEGRILTSKFEQPQKEDTQPEATKEEAALERLKTKLTPIEDEKVTTEPVPPASEQKDTGGLQKASEDVIAGISGTGQETEGTGEIRDIENASLEKLATESGKLVEDTFGEPHVTTGRESDIYLNEEKGTVTKINHLTLHGTWKEFFERINLHNELFPNEAYTLVGYTKKNDRLVPIMEQPLVREDKQNPLTEEERVDELAKRGFIPVRENVFYNKELGITLKDATAENVIRDENGDIRFIDPILSRENPLLETKSEPVAEQPTQETGKEVDAGKVSTEVLSLTDVGLQSELDSFENTIKEREQKVRDSNTQILGNNMGIGTLTEDEFQRYDDLKNEYVRRNPRKSQAEAKVQVQKNRSDRIAQGKGFDNASHLLASVKKRTGKEYATVQEVPKEVLGEVVGERTIEEKAKEIDIALNQLREDNPNQFKKDGTPKAKSKVFNSYKALVDQKTKIYFGFQEEFNKRARDESEKSRLESEKLSQEFENRQKELEKGMYPEDIEDEKIFDEVNRIFEKVNNNEVPTVEEISYVNENAFLPKGFVFTDTGLKKGKRPTSKSDEANAKIAKGLEGIASKIGATKHVNPLDDTSIWDDFKLIAEGLATKAGITIDELIFQLKEKLKGYIKPEHIEAKRSEIEALLPKKEKVKKSERKTIKKLKEAGKIDERIKKTIDATDNMILYQETTNKKDAAWAKQYVDQKGEDKVLRAIMGGFGERNFSLSGLQKTALFTEITDRMLNRYNAAVKSGDKVLEEEAFAQYMDTMERFGELITDHAQALQYMRQFHKLLETEHGAIKYAKKEIEESYKGAEKNSQVHIDNVRAIIEAFDKLDKTDFLKSQKVQDLMNSLKGDKATKEENKKKEKAVKKAIDFLEGLKIKNPNKLVTGQVVPFGILPHAWNAAISLIQDGLKAGLAVSEAIGKAVDYLSSESPGFDEKGFKADMTDNLASVEQERTEKAIESLVRKYDRKKKNPIKNSRIRASLAILHDAFKSGKKLSEALDLAADQAKENNEKLDRDNFREFLEEEVGKEITKQVEKYTGDIKQAVEEFIKTGEKDINGLIQKIIDGEGVSREMAEDYAVKIKELFDEYATKEKKKLLEKYLPKDRTKPINKKKVEYYDNVIELTNAGIVGDELLREELNKALELNTSITKEIETEVKRLVQIIKSRPVGKYRNQATLDLMDYISTVQKFDTKNYIIASFKAGIFSGIDTQAINATSNAEGTLAYLLEKSMFDIKNILTPGKKSEAWTMLKYMFSGGRSAVREALEILRTGKDPRLVESKARRALEATPRSFWGLGKPLKGAYQALDPSLEQQKKYAFRLLAAFDILFTIPISQGIQAVQFQRAGLKDGKKGKELVLYVQDQMGLKQDQWLAALSKAEREYDLGLLPQGKKSTTVKSRASEIIIQNRDQEVVKTAQAAAARQVLTTPPTGHIGMISEVIKFGLRKFAYLNFLLPVVDIPLNLMKRGMQYLPPFILARGGVYYAENLIKGQSIKTSIQEDLKKWKEGDIEMEERVQRALAGTLAIILMMLLLHEDDDEENLISTLTGKTIKIHGSGPGTAFGKGSEPKKQNLLIGRKPFSIQVDDTYIPVNNIPGWAQVFATMGEYQDAVRYRKLSKKDSFERFVFAMEGSMKTIYESGMLKSINDIFDSMSDVSDIRKAPESLITRPATSYLVPKFHKNIINLFNNSIYQNHDIKSMATRGIPVLNGYVNVEQLNEMGEPIKYDFTDRIELWSKVDKTKRIWNKNIENGYYFAKTTMMDLSESLETDVTPAMLNEYLKLRAEWIKTYWDSVDAMPYGKEQYKEVMGRLVRFAGDRAKYQMAANHAILDENFQPVLDKYSSAMNRDFILPEYKPE